MPDTDDGTLTPAELAGLAALLSQPTFEAAAARAGVHERTLRRWLSENEPFKAALKREQRAVLTSVRCRLGGAAAKALKALESVLDATDAPHSSKVAAARVVLDLAHEQIDMDDIAQRLEELERAKRQPRR